MPSPSALAVSCVSRLAAACREEGFAAALREDCFAAEQCPECERLEAEFREGRDRLRAVTGLRRLTGVEERRLIDRVAMAIARIKEHQARHSQPGCEKGVARR